MHNERELWIEEILAKMREEREPAAALPQYPMPQPDCPDLTDVMDVALEEAPMEVVERSQGAPAHVRLLPGVLRRLSEGAPAGG